MYLSAASIASVNLAPALRDTCNVAIAPFHIAGARLIPGGKAYNLSLPIFKSFNLSAARSRLSVNFLI